ncbi:peptidyl-prolyl cis-trans isomerase C [Oryzomicrobium terrae]|uniref:peptidylprolyl isomerase n=1 Tax=Oryzomicrobium terrae TaxID=1735038 RepID=A0A5C1E8K5_9RHOO|nr:peptidylprolyl isomerase [Oryzomicrobium terrae]QEL65213.1 peptidyl-prolyl cis-trans isomerase C [Oryzomicrobium terrae]
MHTLSKLALSLVAASVISAPAFAQSVAKVNGVSISKSLADAIVNEQKAKGAPDNAELRAAVKEELVRREVLAQEAKKKGLDKKADVAAQIDLARQSVLIRAFLQDYMKSNPVTEAQIKQEYDSIKAQMSGNEYHARHILVEKEDDAKAIIAKLKKGEKFADLAKDSKDPGSKDNGGDLGWAPPNAYVKPFADALVKLEKGKYTEAPVKSDFGWHVILLEESRPLTAPPYEQLKPQLAQRVEQKLVDKLIMDLRAKAKVE